MMLQNNKRIFGVVLSVTALLLAACSDSETANQASSGISNRTDVVASDSTTTSNSTTPADSAATDGSRSGVIQRSNTNSATTNSTTTAKDSGSTQSQTTGSSGLTTGSALLQWVAPALNTNGTRINNLAGFYVYTSASSDVTTLERVNLPVRLGPTDTHVTLNGLSQGRHYFAVTAYLTTGEESKFSISGFKDIL